MTDQDQLGQGRDEGVNGGSWLRGETSTEYALLAKTVLRDFREGYTTGNQATIGSRLWPLLRLRHLHLPFQLRKLLSKTASSDGLTLSASTSFGARLAEGVDGAERWETVVQRLPGVPSGSDQEHLSLRREIHPQPLHDPPQELPQGRVPPPSPTAQAEASARNRSKRSHRLLRPQD